MPTGTGTTGRGPRPGLPSRSRFGVGGSSGARLEIGWKCLSADSAIIWESRAIMGAVFRSSGMQATDQNSTASHA